MTRFNTIRDRNCQQIRNKGTFLSLMVAIKNLQPNVILNGEKLNSFPEDQEQGWEGPSHHSPGGRTWQLLLQPSDQH